MIRWLLTDSRKQLRVGVTKFREHMQRPWGRDKLDINKLEEKFQ